MHSPYLDKLSNTEYQALTNRLFNIQRGKCYICQQDIDLATQKTQIDHIIPINLSGKDNETNFAVTHASCNESKQDANLWVARSLHRLMRIQDDVEKREKRAASLKDLLIFEGGSKYNLKYRIDDKTGEFIYSLDDTKDTTIYHTKIFKDALSGEQTCFIELPIEYLYHDELINPRGINSSINLLVKEFYKKNPQLHLSLARIEDGKVRIFDGQHKAAAQILLGIRTICIRLFINPNVNRLTETNANAGSKLRQIAFDKAIMRQLNNTQYLEKVKKYKEDYNLPEDDFSFSEMQLCEYFKGENLKKYIIEAIKSSITSSTDNKMKDFIDFEGKGKSLPLSHSTYDKVFLSKFIDSKNILSSKMDAKLDNGMNPRELEIAQIARLLSLITDVIYVNKFNQEIGLNKIESRIIDGKDSEITDDHLSAYRISKEEILYAWIPYLINIIKMYFFNNGTNFTEGSLFQTPFPDQLWTNLEKFLKSFANLPLWKDRSMASTHFSGKKPQVFWETVFKTGSTPDNVPVLANAINYVDMIK